MLAAQSRSSVADETVISDPRKPRWSIARSFLRLSIVHSIDIHGIASGSALPGLRTGNTDMYSSHGRTKQAVLGLNKSSMPPVEHRLSCKIRSTEARCQISLRERCITVSGWLECE